MQRPTAGNWRNSTWPSKRLVENREQVKNRMSHPVTHEGYCRAKTSDETDVAGRPAGANLVKDLSNWEKHQSPKTSITRILLRRSSVSTATFPKSPEESLGFFVNFASRATSLTRFALLIFVPTVMNEPSLIPYWHPYLRRVLVCASLPIRGRGVTGAEF